MTDESATLSSLLDVALPRGDEAGDWPRVLRDAGEWRAFPQRLRSSGLRWRATLVAAVVLAAAVPLTSLAFANDWWFLGSASVPAPSGDIIVVRSGEWVGVPWTLTAYRSQTQGLCVAFTPNAPDARPATPNAGHTAAMTCDPDLSGLVGAPKASVHTIGFIGSSAARDSTSAFPGFVVTDTFAAPDSLGAPVRFYVAPVPEGNVVTALVAVDGAGNSLETITVPQAPPTQGAQTVAGQTKTVGGTVVWGP
jgi:hypothetical protein